MRSAALDSELDFREAFLQKRYVFTCRALSSQPRTFRCFQLLLNISQFRVKSRQWISIIHRNYPAMASFKSWLIAATRFAARTRCSGIYSPLPRPHSWRKRIYLLPTYRLISTDSSDYAPRPLITPKYCVFIEYTSAIDDLLPALVLIARSEISIFQARRGEFSKDDICLRDLRGRAII